MFCFHLNQLTWEEISGYEFLPLWSVSLNCTPICLLAVHSSIHPSTSKQYTMFPRQVVIATVLQRIIKVDLSIQYKGKLVLLIHPCFLLPFCSIVPYRNAGPKLLSLFLFYPSFIPSLFGITFPLLLYGRTDSRFVLSFILPASYWGLKTMGCSPPPSQLTANLREGNTDSNNAAVRIHKACFLSAFNCFIYCPSRLSFCSVLHLLLARCLPVVAIFTTSLLYFLCKHF